MNPNEEPGTAGTGNLELGTGNVSDGSALSVDRVLTQSADSTRSHSVSERCPQPLRRELLPGRFVLTIHRNQLK